MFGMERFAELEEPRDLAKFFEDSASRAWNGFRETEVATYVGLCVPSMLMRTPYEHKMISAHGDTFDFTESTNPSDPSQYVWGGSAWALAARVTSAFARYGWCAMINGVEAGKVDDLPDRAKVDTDFTGLVGPVDARISDRREVELSNLGFIPLTEARSGRLVAFFSAPTTAKPTAYDSSEATMAARLSARLPYVFATSRFAQYLKVIMRDKIGGFMSIEETERLLNEWIQRYLADGNELSADARARYPLAEARIDVQELPGTREHHAFAYLNPVFQLEPLPVSMRVVVRLPQPAM
jgi:type VI secretion system protein ImpC